MLGREYVMGEVTYNKREALVPEVSTAISAMRVIPFEPFLSHFENPFAADVNDLEQILLCDILQELSRNILLMT